MIPTLLDEHARSSSDVYEPNLFGPSFSPHTPLALHGEYPDGFTANDPPRPALLPGIGSQAPPQRPPQPKVPFWKTRKFIRIQIAAAVIGIILLFISLFPVVRAIAQAVVNQSVLNIATAAIVQPQNSSFQLTMIGNVSHAGIFNAKIHFTEPIQVGWVDGTGKDANVVHLGHMNFDTIVAKSKRATINQTQNFVIDNEDAFGAFTAAMITRKNFTWRLQSNNLRVNALAFPAATGIKFQKDTTLDGINNFNSNVKLLSFQLPHDDPAGGITFRAVTGLNNPSPFKVDLGTTVFDLTYKDVFLGRGVSPNTKIAPHDNSVTLDGRLVPHNNSASELAVVSDLFTRFLNGENSPVIARGVSTRQPDGTAVSWLSKGLQNLALTVPFQAPHAIDAIRSIDIGYLNLSFTPESAWTPATTSDAVHATMELPFGFNMNIGQIANSFGIVQNNSVIANLSTPLGASTSSVQVLGPGDTRGSINITLAQSPLVVPDKAHALFSTFNTELTDAQRVAFQLQGHSRAVANLSIGQIVLDPIKFDVTSGLDGLRGLQGSTTIDGVDVAGGTADHINLNINVTIVNPSSLNLKTGDLVLQLTRDGAPIGTTTLPDLNLLRGKNTLVATSAFQPNQNPQGQKTLNEFLGQKDVALGISGFGGSTKVESLLQAFESLHIAATLPGLKTNLLESTSLKILPTTGTQNNVAHVTVNLNNPFTAGLKITNVKSNVKSHGLNLGTIDTATNFQAGGHAKSQSPNFDLNMNLDPPTMFTLLRRLATQSGQSTGQIDSIVALGGYKYVPSTDEDSKQIARRGPERRDNQFTNFNLPSFVNKAFKQLQSDIELQSEVFIGDYKTTLAYTQQAVPVITDDSLQMLLPLLAHPIVQKIIDGSALGIDTVLIQNAQQNSFDTVLSGSITNAGPLDAAIEFPNGLTISWSGKPLGTMAMPKVQVAADVGAKLNLAATFKVADVGHLTSFTKVLLTQESFTWDISGDNLTVSALGMSVPGVALKTKTVTLKGMNGLKNGVKINSFDLPANDPAGGVHLTLQTTVANPSQVGIKLNSIGFNNYVGQTFLGPAASTGEFALAPRSASNLPLAGRLVHQDSGAGLATVSQIFSDFIHGKSTNVNVVGNSAGPSDVSWLNEAIKSLQVSTVLPSLGPLQVIKSIAIQQMELDFTPGTAFNPATSSNAITAAFQIPFAFPIDIVQVEQTIVASAGGTSFAQLVVPKSPARTDVQSRILHLGFSNVPFTAYGNKHAAFEQFLAHTTVSASETFQLSGSANTVANTAIGTLSLTDIKFDVPSTLAGLQGLNAKPAVVSNLDVNHGFPDYLLIKVDTQLNNPSNLTIGTGDVAFTLLFDGKDVGRADISNLKVVPGDAHYPTDVHFQPAKDAQGAGLTLLENYLQGVTSRTVIVGSKDTTRVESLVPALEQIKLNADIPALHQNLITATNIKFPLDILKTGIAQAAVTISNPFTASINLLVVTATAIFQDLTLGTVDHVDLSAHPLHVNGHTNVTAPPLPLKFNLDPKTIIQMLAILAKQKQMDLGPLPALFQIVLANPNFHPPITVSVNPTPTCVSGKQFDVAGTILKALAGLQVQLNVDTVAKLDDFKVELVFKQFNVPAITDQSALLLIGAVSPPIVQTLVNQATLSFDVANITNISDDGFDLSLHGKLVGTGPLDAQITFMEPVRVTWQGKNIATITLPPVCAAANDGVPDYRTQGRLHITDAGKFADFATFLLHNPSFDWTISTDKLRVAALGANFDGVSLSKTVSFKAFNGLPGVTISNFNLPGDNPAGGITISTDSLIPSPAQLGIQLGTVTFNSYFNGVLVGPLKGTNLFLGASSTTKEHLDGRITPKKGGDLDAIGVLFSNFLAGKNQTLEVRGDTVDPSGQGHAVSWLSTAFKTLKLDVVLPGHVFQIIQSITIEDLELVLNKPQEDFNPLTSSKTTLATFKNPFGFSLQVVKSSQDLFIGANGMNAAELKIPMSDTVSGVSTGNVANLAISFKEQTLHSLNNAVFGILFAIITDHPAADATLQGTSNVMGRTTIGDIAISGIPFNVPSRINGMNAFGGTTTLSNVKIVGSGGTGGNQFIRSPLTTSLQNPSNISLTTNNIALPVIYKNVQLGRATIDNFNLVPGQNLLPSEFHYMPDNANDTIAQSFISSFLTTSDDLPLTIKGDAASSPYGSLQPALGGLTLTTSLKGANVKLLTHINVFVSLQSLATDMVSINFDVINPLDADLVIRFVQSDGSVDGTTFAHFDQSFDNFVVPAKGTANSGTFGNVRLVQGARNSLGIIPRGKLDIAAAQTVQTGRGGYTLPWLKIFQPDVPTTYHLDLGPLSNLPLPALESAIASMEAAKSSPPTASASAAQAASAGAPSKSAAPSENLGSPGQTAASPGVSDKKSAPSQR